MGDSGEQHKSKIKYQNAKLQSKNQKFSLSAHLAGISGEMQCSI